MHRPLFLDVQLRSWAAAVLLLAVAGACSDTVAPERDVAGPRGPSLSVVASSPTLETFFGPERFTRGKGGPETFTRQISTTGFEAPFVLHVHSGDANGANRVSSATARLDGNIVLAPSAFSQQQSEWTLPVTLGGTAELSVSLASAPGSYLEMWVEGKRSGTLFCPDGRPGSIPNLQQAIDRAPIGGTVLVCDGLHDVDEVVVNKPLTLRSQNPHGATLGDSDPSAPLQGGRPALWISGISSGLVRIADISFEVKGRAIVPQGTFDRVAIDSVRFHGRDSTTAVTVMVRASSVPGARVDVTNSHFEHMAIGVFAVGPVEVNATHSTFERFDVGSITHSSTSPGAYSFGRIEDNLIQCGRLGCIRSVGVANLVIARNRLEMPSGASRRGILVNRNADASDRRPLVIEDNEIVGARTGQDPMTTAGWTITDAIQINDAPGVTDVVRRNRITDAHTALAIIADVDARDNVVTGGAYGFRQLASRTVTVSRNDFTELVSSFQAPSSGGSYSCNWWGSASGPSTPPGNVTPSTYAPWATQPIAGTNVSCDPAAPVTAIRVCSTAIEGGPMTAATFAQAYKLVAAGGTISFCAGTHTVSNASIGKPLTVTSESGTMATLDGGDRQVFSIANVVPQGTVNLTRLRFVGGTTFANVFVGTNGGIVNVSSNEFHPPQTGPYGGTVGWLSGLQLGGTGIGVVNVDDNTFLGGDIGFHINSQSGSPTLRRNTFLNQNNSSIHIAGPKPGPIVIEGNTFRGCGPNWCLFTQHGVTATGNTVEIPTGRSTYAPFRIDNFSGGTSVVAENVIIGTLVGVNRSLDSNYSIRGRAIQVYGAGQIERNRILSAFNGIGASNAALSGSDNIIEHTYAPFASGGSPSSSTISMTRNDLLDYIATLDAPWAFSAVSLRCNYWGSASGPTGITGDVAWYAPYSTQPIANKPNVICP